MRKHFFKLKSLAVLNSLALLPASAFAADLVVEEQEKVSAIWSLPGQITAPDSTIRINDGNITVKGSLNIDSRTLLSTYAKYIIYTTGGIINLGQGSSITSDNSENVVTVENGGLVTGSDIDIIGLDTHFQKPMAMLYGIHTLAPAGNSDGKYVDLQGLTQLTLNNMSGDAVGIQAECVATCAPGSAANIQLDRLGLDVVTSGNATGIAANNQNIAFGYLSLVVNSEGQNASINGLVANNGVITANAFTGLSLSGAGLLTAIAANGSQANIDLQGGTAISLYRDDDNVHGVNGIVANDGASVSLRDSEIILTSKADVDATDIFLSAQNSLSDATSRIVVNGDLNAQIDSISVKPSSIIFVNAEGNSAIDLHGDVTLGDLSNAQNATAFLARNNAQIAMTDHTLKAWGNIIADNGDITLRAADNSYLYSTTAVQNNGRLDLSLNGAASIWDMTGSSSLSNLELNQGKINFLNESASAFKTLTVDGNYSGNGGTLVMNVTLNSDNDSPGDKMVVKGDTHGNTTVRFNNIYGHGDHTDMGIELITVAGTSAGQFSTDRRIGIGLYDYDLVQKGKNWYLSNSLDDIAAVVTEPVVVGDEPANAEEQAPSQINNGDTPQAVIETPTAVDTGPGRYDYAKVYRPESGSYIANMAAANTLFYTRLHDRQCERDYVDAITGERHSTTMWMRNAGAHTRFEEGSGQLISRSNSYTLQLGGDLAQWSTNGQDNLRVGMMVGYGNSKNKTRSQVTQYTSRGQTDGYSAGLYATWFADDATRTGAWVDSWIQYSWFNNSVSADDMRTEKYRSRGITASLEAGYSLPLGQSARFGYWLEPRAQAVLMNVKADSLYEEQGTHVRSTGDGNVMTQIGVRAWMQGLAEKGTSDAFRPYAEVNWVHNSEAFGVEMNREGNAVIGSKDSVEARIGAEGQVAKQLALWASVGQRYGQHKYSETQGLVGIKYAF